MAMDVIDIKPLAETKKGAASAKMRNLHKLALARMSDPEMNGITHAYAWNDSVLFVALLNAGGESVESILRQVSSFKLHVDTEIGKSYVVCVKGQAFARVSDEYEAEPKSSRCTILKASSYAMANCFLIESALKKHRADWYIDSRVKVPQFLSFADEAVSLLPSRKSRSIRMFRDYLHPTSMGHLESVSSRPTE